MAIPIAWFAHQRRQYRADRPCYAWGWVRRTDPNGCLQVLGSQLVKGCRRAT